jgi:MHS family proline/betaine transporter-like MFS transporter
MGILVRNMTMANNNLQTISGILGNVLEWYDFGIYGFFSDTISQVFFPPEGIHNLVFSYLIFGAAFLMRPMGGLITGHIGDVHGRKRALVFSMLFMTIPTVAMGFLPTYQQVGGWSTVLLALCRCLQGFSVGGQLPSSVVYTLEMKPKEHWGFYGSLIGVSSFVFEDVHSGL